MSQKLPRTISNGSVGGRPRSIKLPGLAGDKQCVSMCSEYTSDTWYVHAVDISDGCMQWIIVMAACSGY